MQGMTKKETAQARSDFALHVLLIRKELNCADSQARVAAWLEGPPGLQLRLGLLRGPTTPDKPGQK